MEYISNIIKNSFMKKFEKYLNKLKGYLNSDVQLDIEIQSLDIFELVVWKKSDCSNKFYIFLGNLKIKSEQDLVDDLLLEIFEEISGHDLQLEFEMGNEYDVNLNPKITVDFLNEKGLEKYQQYSNNKKTNQIIEEKKMGDIVFNALNQITNQYVEELKKYFINGVEFGFTLDNLLRSMVSIKYPNTNNLRLEVFIDDPELLEKKEMIDVIFKSIIENFKEIEAIKLSTILNEQGIKKYNDLKEEYKQKIINLSN